MAHLPIVLRSLLILILTALVWNFPAHAQNEADRDDPSRWLGAFSEPGVLNNGTVASGESSYVSTSEVRASGATSVAFERIGSLRLTDMNIDRFIVHDGRAYMPDREGITVVNIENPRTPYREGTAWLDAFDSIDWITDLAASGNTLWLALRRGVMAFDISDPLAPKHLGTDTWLPGIYATTITTGTRRPDLAYVGIEDNATTPSFTGVHELERISGDRIRIQPRVEYQLLAGPHHADAILVDNPEGLGSDRRMIVWEETDNVSTSFLSVSQKRPTIQSTVFPRLFDGVVVPKSSWGFFGMEVGGDHLYLALSEAGLQIVAVPSQQRPSLVGAYKPANADIVGVAVRGNRALVADAYLGLKLLDVTDPTDPVLIDQMGRTSGPLYWWMEADDDYVYVLTDDGLEIFRVSGWSSAVGIDVPDLPDIALDLTASAYPNPFNNNVTISFGIPLAGPATVEVFDMLGRRVAVLLDEHAAAGTHEVAWDATGNAAGIYLYRVSTSEASTSGTVVNLR